MDTIGFIGAGKVGTVLARYFTANQFPVSGFYSRDYQDAQHAAHLSKSQAFKELDQLVAASQWLFITVPDQQIQAVWQELASLLRPDQLVFHCSGALTTAVFTPNPEAVATFSLHPLMAFHAENQDLTEVAQAFFTIQSESERLPEVLQALAPLGNQVAVLAATDKVRYHAACVMNANLVIGLVKSANDLFAACDLPQDFIEAASGQLFAQNAQNLVQESLVNSLTGPVARNDVETVQAHLAALPDHQKTIYRELSKALLPLAKEKNPELDQTELERILD